ncbi:hypothetical protein [Photorhabdus stackebrandtii]|uniref:hypothetical protein n=1 Tax=Photorhabdus stackebrandtii TaxID=1123042 RepID=UPI001F60E9D7|nr:hypothetical protein [Photorhabdus stackebrandtii]
MPLTATDGAELTLFIWPDYVGDVIEDAKNSIDYKIGEDSNAKEKRLIIEDVLKDIEVKKKKSLRNIYSEAR